MILTFTKDKILLRYVCMYDLVLDYLILSPHTGTRQVCRCWQQLDLDELKHDILQSVLITDSPADVDEYFVCYNDVTTFSA